MSDLVQQHLAGVVTDSEVTARLGAEGHAFDALEGRLLRGPVREHGHRGQVHQLQLVLLL